MNNGGRVCGLGTVGKILSGVRLIRNIFFIAIKIAMKFFYQSLMKKISAGFVYQNHAGKFLVDKYICDALCAKRLTGLNLKALSSLAIFNEN